MEDHPIYENDVMTIAGYGHSCKENLRGLQYNVQNLSQDDKHTNFRRPRGANTSNQYGLRNTHRNYVESDTEPNIRDKNFREPRLTNYAKAYERPSIRNVEEYVPGQRTNEYNSSNIQDDDSLYLTPTHQIQAAVAHPTIRNTPSRIRRQKPVVSLYDEDNYALPDLSPYDEPSEETERNSTNKDANTINMLWKKIYRKRCALITASILSLLCIGIVVYVVVPLNPDERKSISRYNFLIGIRNSLQ